MTKTNLTDLTHYSSTDRVKTENFDISLESMSRIKDNSYDVELLNNATNAVLSIEFCVKKQELIYNTKKMLEFLRAENVNDIVKTHNQDSFKKSVEALYVIHHLNYSLWLDVTR